MSTDTKARVVAFIRLQFRAGAQTVLARRAPHGERRIRQAMEPLERRWQSSVLLADGAMGTLLFERGGVSSCVEMLNLHAPADVEAAHREYIEAGAQIIETNTFAANRLKLAAHDVADRVVEINRSGVALAKKAASGKAYVAGSIGPLGGLLQPLGHVDAAEALDVFAEHARAVAAEKPDLLLLETFTSLDEVLLAVRAAKSLTLALPIVASLSVLEDGATPAGDPLLDAFRRLRDAGADGVGVNCAVGPQAVYDALAPIIDQLDCPLFVMPNAGYPQRIDDRTVYESTPAYFARFAQAFVDLGATVVGGCCGTTPRHIAAMAPHVVGQRPQRRYSRSVPTRRPLPQPSAIRRPLRQQTPFEHKLGKRFVVTVEIAPPRGSDIAPALAAANLLKHAGADAFHISDNPTARLRMSGTAAAHLIMGETGLAAILHFSCRDRNLLSLQSELLGAAALGIPAIVALTGDPTNVGDFPKATSVFDVTAMGLTRIVRGLNAGRDHGGHDIGAATRFRIGTAVNAHANDVATELSRFEEKVAAGADFIVTPPIFDPGAAQWLLRRAEAARIPVLAGLLPLRDYAQAEYLHNEIPGMRVPEAIRERLRAATDQESEGLAIASELLAQFSVTPGVAGVYVICQENYELAARLIMRPDAHRDIVG